jgi:hypothetical protein
LLDYSRSDLALSIRNENQLEIVLERFGLNGKDYSESPKAVIKGLLDHIFKKYGSVFQYINDELNIDHQKIKKIVSNITTQTRT